jgi:hypothetical protein
MLAGLAVEPVARKVYVFAPPSGWSTNSSGFFLPSGSLTPEMLMKTMRDIQENLSKPMPDMIYVSRRQYDFFKPLFNRSSNV